MIVSVYPVSVPNSIRIVPMVVSMRPRFSSCLRMFGSIFAGLVLLFKSCRVLIQFYISFWSIVFVSLRGFVGCRF